MQNDKTEFPSTLAQQLGAEIDLTGSALSAVPRLIVAKAETAASLCLTEILLSPSRPRGARGHWLHSVCSIAHPQLLWSPLREHRLNVLPSLVTEPSFLLFWELRFSINVKHLLVWVTVCDVLGEDCMKSAGEIYNLHWYLLKYDHLCYNLLILVKGFARYRKIYNVMDYYFIIWAKGKKLQIFAGFFYCISNFFQFWKHNTGETVGGCSHTKYGIFVCEHITCFIWISKHV